MVTWYLLFQVNDAEAETRYRYIVKALRADSHVASVEESIDGSTRELTVDFRSNLRQPNNPSLQHLHKVYGTTQRSVDRLSFLDRLLTVSPLDG